jgi:P-type Cu2+ transporter
VLRANQIAFDEPTYEKLAQQGKTVIFVLKDNVLQGMIALADIIRESSYKVIKELNNLGIETVMMTGDNNRVANYVGEKLGMSKVIAEVLPHEKSNNVEKSNVSLFSKLNKPLKTNASDIPLSFIYGCIEHY